MTLFVSIFSLLFSSSAFAAVNRNYERNISATVDDRITVDVKLRIYNLIGILKTELPIEGETVNTEVIVVKDMSGAKMETPREIPHGVYYDQNTNTEYTISGKPEIDTSNGYRGKVEVEIVNSDRPIYNKELGYSIWYSYDPDRGFYNSGFHCSGIAISNRQGGELDIYYNGLSAGRVYFAYTLEPLDYEWDYQIINAGEEDSLHHFWVGTRYLLVLSDEEIEYFLTNGELPEYKGFKWPGLYDLLTANNIYENFTVKYEYKPGQFAYIKNQWYADSVRKVYELGLMKGNPDGNFYPDGTITLAEVVTMAARLHNICTGGSGEFTQGTTWYKVYVD